MDNLFIVEAVLMFLLNQSLIKLFTHMCLPLVLIVNLEF